MLDAAHTGTLNADNLYEGLRRVDSEITREEVEAALKKLDKDGNGEIDFDDFLFHMTQGDLLEGMGGDGMYLGWQSVNRNSFSNLVIWPDQITG